MVTTARGTPSGTVLEDGFVVKIAFAASATIAFEEKTVQPPGLDGGDPIDVTTQFNVKWRGKAARSLITGTDAQTTVAYDPAVLTAIETTLLNVNGWITIHFPDGSTYDFIGYLKEFVPQSASEGSQPEANVVIVRTDRLAGVETDPVYTAPSP